ncbi:tetratricopeptide repeat protein [Fusobacterium sp. HMSC073F01]|uniref:tetratricopeptide repeat protein n=1 Tax=Fusobacterium sp. HMSC073F01 TaxID=1739251 RepID=UPI0008A55BAA|nr:tetratricopeptide repeat protein [Fusobacterium sp. HMSC073F01]OFL94316.1 hypothetical protein HMPREF2747_16055 [Fusobacterium sp. HMSC073F01]
MKLYEEAISDFTKAIELDSEFIFAYHKRGIAKYKLKNYIGANSDFKKANELNPKLKNPFKD